jgi:hypothetical protein
VRCGFWQGYRQVSSYALGCADLLQGFLAALFRCVSQRCSWFFTRCGASSSRWAGVWNREDAMHAFSVVSRFGAWLHRLSSSQRWKNESALEAKSTSQRPCRMLYKSGMATSISGQVSWVRYPVVLIMSLPSGSLGAQISDRIHRSGSWKHKHAIKHARLEAPMRFVRVFSVMWSKGAERSPMCKKNKTKRAFSIFPRKMQNSHWNVKQIQIIKKKRI